MIASRILDLWYVKNAELSAYDMNESYDFISAKDSALSPNPDLLVSGIDIGLFCLYIHDAPERRKLLGLVADKHYEIMVNFSPVHLHGTEKREVMKVSYGKFFNIDAQNAASGFNYKKMFVNLQLKGSLNFDVKLTEIDNKKVDPDPLSKIFANTGIGSVLDLSPFNPREYIELASNLVNSVQDLFGADKAGDDILWDDTLSMEPKPTIPGSYRLREGIYAIVEHRQQPIDMKQTIFLRNRLLDKTTQKDIAANYLVFGIGQSIPNS